MRQYKQIPHTADLAAEIYGNDIPELFGNAAYAMFDMMIGDPEIINEVMLEMTIQAEDTEGLLIKWLNELLFNFESEQLVFENCRITSLTGTGLKALIKYKRVCETENTLKAQIKAATYHDLNLQKTNDGYSIIVVFDV